MVIYLKSPLHDKNHSDRCWHGGLMGSRARKEFFEESALEIMLINAHPYHSLRPCNYEEDLERFIYPLADIVTPIGVKLIIDEVKI